MKMWPTIWKNDVDTVRHTYSFIQILLDIIDITFFITFRFYREAGCKLKLCSDVQQAINSDTTWYHLCHYFKISNAVWCHVLFHWNEMLQLNSYYDIWTSLCHIIIMICSVSRFSERKVNQFVTWRKSTQQSSVYGLISSRHVVLPFYLIVSNAFWTNIIAIDLC